MVLQRVDVYSGSLALLGHLPANQGVLASRDAKRAFVYRDDGADGAPARCSRSRRRSPSPTARTTRGRLLQLAATPDDRVVFVSGDSRILVVPVS